MSTIYETILSIKQKMYANKVVFTRADTVNTVIALNESTYVAKTQKFIKTEKNTRSSQSRSNGTFLKRNQLSNRELKKSN